MDGVRVEADPLHARSREHREQIRQIRLRAQMVFQEFNLFPHLKVIDNLIEAPIRVKGVPRDRGDRRPPRSTSTRSACRDKRDEYPARLSGGQKQRVAIARALTMEPKVLLFDEPTSALDPTLVGEVLKVMEELAHEGATMIVVTHEMAFAREAADRVYFIEEGVFLEAGPPEQVIDDPQDPRTREFLSSSSGSSVPRRDLCLTARGRARPGRDGGPGGVGGDGQDQLDHRPDPALGRGAAVACAVLDPHEQDPIEQGRDGEGEPLHVDPGGEVLAGDPIADEDLADGRELLAAADEHLADGRLLADPLADRQVAAGEVMSVATGMGIGRNVPAA